MSNNETKLLEPINYTIMHTIYQQFSVLTENSALAPSLLALGLTVFSLDLYKMKLNTKNFPVVSLVFRSKNLLKYFCLIKDYRVNYIIFVSYAQ